MTEKSQDFLLAEFQALRREIEIDLAQMRALGRYGVFATAALWGWFLTQPTVDTSAMKPLPAILVFLLFLYSCAFRADLRRIGSYIASVEDVFELRGWENRLKKGWMAMADWVEYAYWLLLFSVNVWLAL